MFLEEGENGIPAYRPKEDLMGGTIPMVLFAGLECAGGSQKGFTR